MITKVDERLVVKKNTQVLLDRGRVNNFVTNYVDR